MKGNLLIISRILTLIACLMIFFMEADVFANDNILKNIVYVCIFFSLIFNVIYYKNVYKPKYYMWLTVTLLLSVYAIYKIID